MLSKRFPFGIYYEMEDDVVYLYAIQDCGVIRFGFRNVCRREIRRAFVGKWMWNKGGLSWRFGFR